MPKASETQFFPAMQFIDRKRARPIIPLVSLIDILTILLIFFIVASEFRQEQQHEAQKEKTATERRLDIALPGVSDIEGNPVNDTRQTISLDKDGAIALDGTGVADPAALVEALNARRAADPVVKFELAPDENVPLGKLIGVWDALTKAGIPVAEVPARVVKRP